MTDPLFWLVLSFLFVTVSLTIVLVVAIPTLRELSRAARSAEKLFDTLRHEFPPTLEAIRLTGLEISNLTDDLSEGMQGAGQVVKQVDQSLTSVRKQARRAQVSTRSLGAGLRAAWRSFTHPRPPTQHQRRASDRLPPATRSGLELTEKPREHFDRMAERSNWEEADRPPDLVDVELPHSRRAEHPQPTAGRPLSHADDPTEAT